jgi:CheY-like chemotaxis protein
MPGKPTILTVDDDPMVSAAITRDLRSRYGADYRIVRATSGAEALAVLTKLALRGQPVALIASDQRMPEMTGIEMLEQARPQLAIKPRGLVERSRGAGVRWPWRLLLASWR